MYLIEKIQLFVKEITFQIATRASSPMVIQNLKLYIAKIIEARA